MPGFFTGAVIHPNHRMSLILPALGLLPVARPIVTNQRNIASQFAETLDLTTATGADANFRDLLIKVAHHYWMRLTQRTRFGCDMPGEFSETPELNVIAMQSAGIDGLVDSDGWTG
jgi:hypothetical protein